MTTERSARMIASMYECGKVTPKQVVDSVKGRFITDEQAKEILGDNYPKEPEVSAEPEKTVDVSKPKTDRKKRK